MPDGAAGGQAAAVLPKGIVQRQTRAVTVERVGIDKDARLVSLAVSSEIMVERYWGGEILGHQPDEIDLDWFRSGRAPLLLDHDPRAVIGVVENVELGADRKLRVVARCGSGTRAEEAFMDMADGIRGNISVGYELLELRLEKEEKGKPPVYRAIRWRPLEVSLVGIPADMTVGVGRSASAPVQPSPRSSRMEPRIEAGGPPSPPASVGLTRVQQEIMALAELAQDVEAGRDAVIEGISVDEFRRRMLKKRSNDRPLGLPPMDAGHTTGDRHLDVELQTFSLVRAIAGQVPDLRVDSGRERELSKEIAKRSGRQFQGMAVPTSIFLKATDQRVLTTGLPVGGPGSNIIETVLDSGKFIDRLRAALRVRALGATVLSGLRGNVDIPKMKASATAGWVAENAAISPSDNQFDKVSLTPKHAGALTELSRNMLLQSSPDIEQLVRDDFAKILAEAMDTAAIAGTGSSNQPTGILATSGIGDVAMGANGGPITWEAVINLIGEVEIDSAEGTGFLTNAKVVRSARKTVKVTGQPVYVMEGRNELAGYPLAQTSVVPSNLTKGTSSGVCSALIFGNWSDLLLAYWSEVDILVNPYESTAYSKGNVQVRGMMTCDIAVRHPESFAAIKDLTTP